MTYTAQEPDYSAGRRLPVGETRTGCAHSSRCDVPFGAVRRGFTSCDFWLSRYIPVRSEEKDQ